MSKLAKASIVICGKETITPSDGTEEIRVEGTEEFFDIKAETFTKYFTIGTAVEGASDLCTVNKYEIVDAAG
jgi:hypothetical protein